LRWHETNGVDEEHVKLKAFPFFLKGAANANANANANA
jgi:hypothetical protein